MSIIEKALDKLSDPDSFNKKIKQVRENTDDSTNIDQKTDIRSDKKADNKQHESKSIDLELEALGKRGYLTPNTNNKVLFEQYRRIKLPVLKTAFENKDGVTKNIVMVTSSLSGEGKSFTSMNLAMSIAYEYNYTVLLIDGDITKKMSSKVLGVEGSSGLIDYLSDRENRLENLILKTNIKKLNIIPSGSYTEMITELFSSKKMTQLIQELSSRYSDRLIIIDTPPVLEDSSAKVLANLADQIVYIIEAEKTPKHVVEQGLRMLGRTTDIGIVLNKSNNRHSSSYYYV